MPPVGVHDLPPDLVPGNGARSPNTSLHTGPFNDGQQTLSPIDIAENTPHTAPWTSPGPSPVDNPHQQPDDRDGRSQEPGHGPRDRSNGERTRHNAASGSKSPAPTTRICKKCTQPLLGQFVRALGATYHLECYQCEVSFELCVVAVHRYSEPALTRDLRTVEKLSRRSFSLSMLKMGADSTLSARQIIFDV